MISRLEQLLKAENISRSQFAEMLGIAPATVTHLLNGRNKPSFEIIQSISANFPTINLEWLINGTGKMYKTGENSDADDGNGELFKFSDKFDTLNEPKQTIVNKQNKSPKTISKIVIFYNDGTFQDVHVK